jgi:hypothetical protein
MPLSWWRQHGEHFIHIDPVAANEWMVSVWHQSTCILLGSRRFERLLAAKAAADELLRRALRHRCDAVTCGEWIGVAK